MTKFVGQIQLQKKNTVSLGILKEYLTIQEGDMFRVEVEEDGRIVLTPMKLIPADQVWFWSKDWQEGMKEAQRDFQEGRCENYQSMDELISELEKETNS